MDNLKPTIKSIAPKRASIGSKLTISGDNLADTYLVRFGARSAEFIEKDGKIIAVLPDVGGCSIESALVITPHGSAQSEPFEVTAAKIKELKPAIVETFTEPTE